MIIKLKHKGAMFIEYALILAFVIVAGLIFVTSNGMSGNVSTIFSKTADVMEQAASETSKYKSTWKVEKGSGAYGEFGNAIKSARTDVLNPILAKYNGYIDWTNQAAIADLKAAGINVPDGQGNWVLRTIPNDTNGYELTWAADTVTNPNSTVNSYSYYYGGEKTGTAKTRPIITWGTATTGSNGVINSGTTPSNPINIASFNANGTSNFFERYSFAVGYTSEHGF